jgi:hypothetical protein
MEADCASALLLLAFDFLDIRFAVAKSHKLHI